MASILSGSTQAGLKGDIFHLLAGRRNYLAEVRAQANKNRFVIFYGCGVFFESLLGTWNSFVGRKIDFCCDSDPETWGKLFFGIECLSPVELEKIKDQCTVFVTVGNFDPVCNFLRKNGFSSVHLIYKYDLVSADSISGLDPSEIAGKLESVRSLLADETSISVFDAILNRVLNPQAFVGLMSAVCEGDQYFPADIIRLSPDESFVDAGAFDGDTLRDIVRRTRGRFSHVDCFELDSNNYAALQKTAEKLNCGENISLHPAGLWDTSMEITYSVENAQSTVGMGEMSGRVVCLDSAMKNAPVTFLKMDIEGAELKALEGAKRTILANRPKLAICVYHHFRDLWEIPLFISGLVPEYRIFLRHHTKLEYETVCYALPPEDVAV